MQLAVVSCMIALIIVSLMANIYSNKLINNLIHKFGIVTKKVSSNIIVQTTVIELCDEKMAKIKPYLCGVEKKMNVSFLRVLCRFQR